MQSWSWFCRQRRCSEEDRCSFISTKKIDTEKSLCWCCSEGHGAPAGVVGGCNIDALDKNKYAMLREGARRVTLVHHGLAGVGVEAEGEHARNLVHNLENWGR